MDRLAPALRASSARVIELVRSTPDIDVTVPASPRWTVLQTFGHLVNVTPRFVAGPQGGGTWADEPPALAGINDDELSGLGELWLPDLIVEFQDAVEDVIRRVGRFGDEPPAYRYHGGTTVRADRALGILLAEYLIHGGDIARALHERFPIPREEAALAIDGVAPIAAGWVDARHGARAHGDLRDPDPRRGTYTLRFDDGALEVRGRAGRRRRLPDLRGSRRASSWSNYRRGSGAFVRRTPWRPQPRPAVPSPVAWFGISPVAVSSAFLGWRGRFIDRKEAVRMRTARRLILVGAILALLVPGTLGARWTWGIPIASRVR